MIAARDLSIRTKLSAGFVLAFAMVVAIGLIGVAQLRSINRLAVALTDVWIPEFERLGNIRSVMVEYHQLAARRAEAVDVRQLAEIDNRMATSRAALESDGAAYAALADDPEERLLYRNFVVAWTRYEETLAAVRSPPVVGPGAHRLSFDAASDAFRQALQAMDALFAFSKQEGTTAASQVHAIYESFSVMIVAVIGFGALILSAGIFWIARYVTEPILGVSEAMRRLALGDPSAAVSEDGNRKDEIGTLIAAAAGYRDTLVRSQDLAREAERQRYRLDAAVSNMPIGLTMFDSDKRLIIANSRYAEMYHLPRRLMEPGTSLRDILNHRIGAGSFDGSSPEAWVEDFLGLIDRRETLHDIRQFRDGRIFSVIHQPMEGGGWVSTHEDVTDRVKAEARIAHMTSHDALTDLPNRRLFRERIEEALLRETQSGEVAVLYLDLDHFKGVNDTLGHPVGDKLLQAVAERLTGVVRDTDTVARLDGDEFAVVQVGADQPRGSRSLAHRAIEHLSAPYSIHGHQVVIGVSIGVAIAPADGDDANHLLKNSHIALYRAKTEGRGICRFFEQEMDARMQARRALEIDLRGAESRNEFELWYQPQINLETNAVTSFEALLRWRHPERGLVTPEHFISVAEETGLVMPIGEWALRQACKDAAHWPSDVRVAVNLSPTQFHSARLLPAVVGALAAARLTPGRLELEITENVLLADTDAILALLHQLRALGVRVAMDDFGTGYSSLSYFQKFRFDRIKIDQRFVKGICDDDNSLAIIRAVVGMSASMGVATTAEGVETEEQLRRVKAEGCTEAQGFLLGRPVPADDATDLLGTRRGQGVAAA